MKKELILRILFLLFWTSSLFAQIPINGFCKLTEFSVKPNYSSIVAVDYNSDGYRDLVFYNPTLNNYSTLTSDSRSSFGKASEKYSSFSLAVIHPYFNDKSSKRFIALSRKTREAGIVTFSRTGSLITNSKIKFDGYASTIDVGKVEEGIPSNVLCAGAGMDGLVLAKERSRRLNEDDRIKGKIFSAAVFIDLNYDGYEDIAAIDLVSNSIVFYNNDEAGSFEESRSIGLGSEVSEFRALDFNSDRFTDLAFIKNNNLEILLGDSVSSFQRKFHFATEQGVSKYTILDFNGDGFNDVAFINQSGSKLFISFAKGNNSFYSPVCYISKQNLSDVTSYVDRGGRKLAAVSSTGASYLISSLSMHDETFNIALLEGAATIQAFDYNRDGFKELAFIDAGSNTMKIGLSERRNLLRSYFTFNLSTIPNQFIIDDTKKNVTTFICYRKGEKSLEVLRYNFENNRTSKQIIYTTDPIREVKFSSDRLKDRINICAMTLKNKILSLQEFEMRNFTSRFVEKRQVAANVEDATFNYSVYKDVYALIRLGRNVDLVKIVFDKKEIERTSRLTFEIPENETIESKMISVDELIGRTKPAAALLSFSKKSVLYYFRKEKNIRMEIKERLQTSLPVKYIIDGENVLFLSYSNQTKKFWEMKPAARSAKAIAPIETNGINDYFVATLHGKNKYLIYSSGNTNSITIKKYL